MSTTNVWRVGNVKVTRVAEADDFALDPEFIFPLKAESIKEYEWLKPHFIKVFTMVGITKYTKLHPDEQSARAAFSA